MSVDCGRLVAVAAEMYYNERISIQTKPPELIYNHIINLRLTLWLEICVTYSAGTKS